MKPPKEPEDLQRFSRTMTVTSNRAPLSLLNLDDSLGYHTSRIALLIHKVTEISDVQGIHGRVKLAKLDFFVRYPVFMARAIAIIGTSDIRSQYGDILGSASTESEMVRYRYGPWDHRYYTVLAYMYGKRLISISANQGVDFYTLTENGSRLAYELEQEESWYDITLRCEAISKLFGNKSGNEIRRFIYEQFPEVLLTPYSKPIP